MGVSFAHMVIVSTFGRGIYRTNVGGGYCGTGSTIPIFNSQTWSTNEEVCSNIFVLSGGILTITGSRTMSKNATITVQSGGQLIIDGGSLYNANIIVEDGGTLTLTNNAYIESNYEDDVVIEDAAILSILSGEINSNTIKSE